jgi:hypothetical protein
MRKLLVLAGLVSVGRRYARADRKFGDRPGRAYWLAFARSRRQIESLMGRLP